jgi:hypothetical protein
LSIPESNLESPFERGPAADLWRHTLSKVPTFFGRLEYLSSLRNPNSGLYEHHGLAQMFGYEQADETLRRSHQQVFHEWLCLSLERQKADLEDYLGEQPGGVGGVLQAWLRLAPYRNLAPAAAREVERQLFLTDLEALLELLKRDYGIASPDPE